MKRLRSLPGTRTTYGVCVDCGRRGILHADPPHNCAETARIPACVARRERRERREQAATAAAMLAAMEAEYGSLPE